MRRLLATILLLAAVGAVAVLGTGAGDDGGGGLRYTVELDNAFGVIEDADVKVSGVRAGKVTGLEIDESSEAYRALVEIEITQEGFDDIREDVFCEARPQSLIGEYFLDCTPGSKSKPKLPEGSRIPVKQTGSSVPVDLINNIMRRPYRERFTIIWNELGAGLAGRAQDLNETIRRANPALRETDRVLKILADQRRVIRDLYDDADVVLKALADNRRDVGRFVTEVRDTQRSFAAEAASVKRNWNRLPTFLRELRPTLKLLGEVAEQQTPALRDLNRSAPLAEDLFRTLGPYAEASRPAIRTLAKAARAGEPAARKGRPRVRELARAARPLPEAAQNLAITLEHLDDPNFAVEKDPRSPRNGAGYTGLEAFLRYLFAQSQAINLLDANGYLLKVSAFLDNTCAAYTDAKLAREPTRERCRAWLGPNQPGVNQPDPTATAQPAAARRNGSARSGRSRAATPGASAPATSTSPSPAPATAPTAPTGPADAVRRLLQSTPLLDYLLAP